MELKIGICDSDVGWHRRMEEILGKAECIARISREMEHFYGEKELLLYIRKQKKELPLHRFLYETSAPHHGHCGRKILIFNHYSAGRTSTSSVVPFQRPSLLETHSSTPSALIPAR